MGPEDYRKYRSSKIQLFSRIKPRNIFPGEWESSFTGDGIEFSEIKPFEPGDDLRNLDLHALAQSGEEEIIQRVVERQMRILVWVDLSGSMRRFEQMFFAQKPQIRDNALGLVLFSACNAYCPVGLCAFDTAVLKFFPPRIGERYCWEILGWIVDQESRGMTAAGDVRPALSFLTERAVAHSLVFLVSDFADRAFEGEFTTLLRPVVEKFDLVPVVIRDPLEKEASLKRPVTLTVDDSEGGKSTEVYLTPQKMTQMREASAAHLMNIERNFHALGIHHVVLDSPSIEDCHGILSGFFHARRRTFG